MILLAEDVLVMKKINTYKSIPLEPTTLRIKTRRFTAFGERYSMNAYEVLQVDTTTLTGFIGNHGTDARRKVKQQGQWTDTLKFRHSEVEALKKYLK